MRMTKEKAVLKDTQNNLAVVEFLRSGRTLKRQLQLIKSIEDLDAKEKELILKVLKDLKSQFSVFGI